MARKRVNRKRERVTFLFLQLPSHRGEIVSVVPGCLAFLLIQLQQLHQRIEPPIDACGVKLDHQPKHASKAKGNHRWRPLLIREDIQQGQRAQRDHGQPLLTPIMPRLPQKPLPLLDAPDFEGGERLLLLWVSCRIWSLVSVLITCSVRCFPTSKSLPGLRRIHNCNENPRDRGACRIRLGRHVHFLKS